MNAVTEVDRNLRKKKHGVVVSNKMAKTVVVVVERSVRHPRYQKTFNLRSKFKAHDEKSECQVGDEVVIVETRPISRTKRWRVVEIIKKKQ